jgi:hypothetical protein
MSDVIASMDSISGGGVDEKQNIRHRNAVRRYWRSTAWAVSAPWRRFVGSSKLFGWIRTTNPPRTTSAIGCIRSERTTTSIYQC